MRFANCMPWPSLGWLVAVLLLCGTDARAGDAAPAHPEPVVGHSREFVIGVNANELLCAVAGEQSFEVAIRLAGGGVSTVQKDTPPVETLTISGESDDFGTRGRRYVLIRNGQWVGGVQLGVFEDPNSAFRVFQDHLFHTATSPGKDLSAEFGTKAVAWSRRGEGQDLVRILFVRDNVVISISLSPPRFQPMGDMTKTITSLARKIDDAMVKGTSGVQRGRSLATPRVIGVKILAPGSAGAKLTAEVRIAVPEDPQDKESRETELVQATSFYAVRPDPDEKTQSETAVVYQVTFITKGCVVVSKGLALSIDSAER